MDLIVPNWNKVGELDWEGHPMSVYMQRDAILMLLAEKRSDRTVGFACSTCKCFNLKGDAAKIDLVHFPSELTLVKNLNANSSGEAASTRLLAFTKPTYVPFSNSALLSTIETHEAALGVLAAEVKKLAPSGVVFTECGEGEIVPDATLLMSLLSSLRSMSKPKAQTSIIGIDLNGNTFTSAVSSVSFGAVVGGTNGQRLHCLHVLAEEVLQQNTGVVILDTKNSFAGLSQANAAPSIEEYAAFSLPGLPAAFPFQEVTPGVNSFVDLGQFNASALLSAFGLTGSPLEQHLSSAIEKGEFSEVENSDLNQFTTLKLNRVLNVVRSSFQNIFAHSKPTLNAHSIGKVFHVNLSKLGPEATAFFAMGFLEQLKALDKPLFVLFEQDANEAKTLLELAVDKFTGTNVSILCHSEHEANAPILKTADLFMEVIGKDVAITQAGKPTQRVKLRPTYSACNEN